MKAVISEKGQITIPKKIRMEYGLEAGSVLDFVEEDGVILIRKVVTTNPIRAWRGRGQLPHGASVDSYVKASRDPQ